MSFLPPNLVAYLMNFQQTDETSVVEDEASEFVNPGSNEKSLYNESRRNSMSTGSQVETLHNTFHQTSDFLISNDEYTRNDCLSSCYDTDEDSDDEEFTEAQLNLIEAISADVNGKSILTDQNEKSQEISQQATSNFIPSNSQISTNVLNESHPCEIEVSLSNVSGFCENDNINGDENYHHHRNRESSEDNNVTYLQNINTEVDQPRQQSRTQPDNEQAGNTQTVSECVCHDTPSKMQDIISTTALTTLPHFPESIDSSLQDKEINQSPNINKSSSQLESTFVTNTGTGSQQESQTLLEQSCPQSPEVGKTQDGGQNVDHCELSSNESLSPAASDDGDDNGSNESDPQSNRPNNDLTVTLANQNDIQGDGSMEEEQKEKSPKPSEDISTHWKVTDVVCGESISPSKDAGDAIDYILKYVDVEDVDTTIVNMLCNPDTLEHPASGKQQLPYSVITLDDTNQSGELISQPIELLEVTIGEATEENVEAPHPFLPPKRNSSALMENRENTASTKSKSQKGKSSPKSRLQTWKDKPISSPKIRKQKQSSSIRTAKKQQQLTKYLSSGKQMQLTIPLLPKSLSRKKRIKVLGKGSPKHNMQTSALHDQQASNRASTVGKGDKPEDNISASNDVPINRLDHNLESIAIEVPFDQKCPENANINDKGYIENCEEKQHLPKAKKKMAQGNKTNIKKGHNLKVSVNHDNEIAKKVPIDHNSLSHESTRNKKVSKRTLKKNLWREVIASTDVYDIEFEVLLKEKQELEKRTEELKRLCVERIEDQTESKPKGFVRKKRTEFGPQSPDSKNQNKKMLENDAEIEDDEILELLKEKERLQKSTSDLKKLYNARKRQKGKDFTSNCMNMVHNSIEEVKKKKGTRKRKSCTTTINCKSVNMTDNSVDEVSVPVDSCVSPPKTRRKHRNDKEKFLKQKMKQLEQENKELKNNSSVMISMKEFTDEIQNLKTYLKDMEQKCKSQDSCILALEHEIEGLKRSQQYPVSLPSPCYSDRQDATVTSSESDT